MISFDNPPLVEALCEVHFDSGSSAWDMTVPGRFYAPLEATYPIREQQGIQQINFQQGQEITIPFPAPGPANRVQFKSEDGSKVVQTGPDFVSIHQLAPYKGWGAFKPEILRVLSVYCDTAKAVKANRIALRCINRILMPTGELDFDDYFETIPKVPKSKEQQWANWALRVDIAKPGNAAFLTVQSGTSLEPHASPGEEPSLRLFVVLDFMYGHDLSKTFEMSKLDTWLEEAHREIEDLFLLSLGQKSKLMLGFKESHEYSG